MSDVRKRILGGNAGHGGDGRPGHDSAKASSGLKLEGPLRDGNRSRAGRGSGNVDVAKHGRTSSGAVSPKRDNHQPKMVIRRSGSVGKGKVPGDGHGRAVSATGHAGDDRFKHVTTGSVARRIDLAGQYKMRHDGDVARRMGFDKHSPHGKGPPHSAGYRGHGTHALHHGSHYHLGHVSPHYAKSHFRFHFYWPSYYAGFYAYPGDYYYSYPYWSPWVSWSWYYRCRPVWDPRPIWCRPSIYVACPGWTWWAPPVWEPLPVTVSGTWVNVQREVVPAAQYDLQLLAVRFVDPGHPEEKLGPRYRVWLRNNSEQPIDRPFDVVLLAGNDEKVTDQQPMAGVRIDSMLPGQTQVVDVRLPFAVHQMGRDEKGQPTSFTTLHVLVDANREIDETSEQNNGTRLTADLVLPVDPSAFEVEPKAIAAGGELLLAGEGLGPEPGRVLVHLGGIEMEADILGWYDLGVRFNMPRLPLAGPVEAELIVVRRDGVATNPIAITITPEPVLEEIALPPALPK
ncbi:MAG: hypothetical protein JW888_14310 [Pirellulales bacterium]|nr:hypothetical protein [Pirellulales bacterium]